MYLWPGNQFGSQNQVSSTALGTFDARWARFAPAPTVAGTAGTFVNAGNGLRRRRLRRHACRRTGSRSSPAATPAARTSTRRVQAERRRRRSACRRAHDGGGRAPILSGAMTAPAADHPGRQHHAGRRRRDQGGDHRRPDDGHCPQAPRHPGIRDGDFENGIIIHEYGHGVSTRLTGGPAVNCLSGNEQAGEGWSDYLAISFLLNPAIDDPNEPRGMGPYALFQPDRQGNGIRPRPYSRNMSIQPFTYDSIKTGGWLNGASLALPHGLGHGWAAVLWDLNWDLIDKYGFNPNVYGAWNTGGNNRAHPVRDGRPQAAGLRAGPRRRTRRDHRRRRRAVGRRATPAPPGRRSPGAGSATAPSRERPAATTTRRRSTRTRTATRASCSAVDDEPALNLVDARAARGRCTSGWRLPRPGHPGQRLAVLTAGRLRRRCRPSTRPRRSSRRGRSRFWRRRPDTTGSPTRSSRTTTRSAGRRSRSGTAPAGSSS